MLGLSGIKNGFTILRRRFQLTPSRTGEDGMVPLPNRDAPSEQLTLSGHIPNDPDAGKFEVRQMKLDRKTQMILAAKVAMKNSGLSSPPLEDAFRSMLERADGVQVEVPKKGVTPSRDPEVWLTADGQALMPEGETERIAVVRSNGTHDSVLDAQTKAVSELLSDLSCPEGAKQIFNSFVADGIAQRMGEDMNGAGHSSPEMVKKVSRKVGKELGISLELKPEQNLDEMGLADTLHESVSKSVENRGLTGEQVQSPLKSIVQKYWAEQKEVLSMVNSTTSHVPVDIVGQTEYSLTGYNTFEGMAKQMKSEVVANLLPELLGDEKLD